jgi:RNA polymerase sigma factor (sigma-70 family)
MEEHEIQAYWARLFEEHVADMRAAARGVLRGSQQRGEPAAAGLSDDDVVMNVFQELICGGAPLAVDDERKFLRRRTRSRAVDLIRSANARHSTPMDSRDDVLDGSDLLQHDPEETVVDGVEAALVAGALGRLPEREEFVIEQVIRQGRTQREVAAELDLSERRVGQLISQGYSRLRCDPGLIDLAGAHDQNLGEDPTEGGAL